MPLGSLVAARGFLCGSWAARVALTGLAASVRAAPPHGIPKVSALRLRVIVAITIIVSVIRIGLYGRLRR